MNEALKKGNEFLNYIAKNQNQLKKEFKKGVTYNPDTYDDLWQDTIIKVYDSIVSNNKDINDYKRYFFIALKYSCLYDATKQSRKIRLNDCKEIFELIDEDYKVESESRYIALKELVIEKFGEESAKIFFDYMERKYKNGKISYSSYSEMTGLTFTQIYQIISSIKKFLKSNESFKYYGVDI